MLMKKLALAGVALSTCTMAAAQDYFDFGKIPGVPDTPAVQVDLNPTLLGLASEATRSNDPTTANLLSSIDGIRVRVYKTLEDIDDVADFVDDVANRLEKADWQRVVSIQDESKVRVYVQGDEETITGVTAMIVDNADAVFINIAGSISSEQFAQSIADKGAGGLLASLGKINFGD